MIGAISEFEQHQHGPRTVIGIEQLHCDIGQIGHCGLDTHWQHVDVHGLDAQSCQQEIGSDLRAVCDRCQRVIDTKSDLQIGPRLKLGPKPL